jgi:acyl transferase domain-containing protein
MPRFSVYTPKQANTMDPQLRLLMEVTYEAILDAGALLIFDFVFVNIIHL